LTSTTPNEITDTINSYRKKRLTGFDDISPYFLKLASCIISRQLSIIFNHYMTFGVFPNKLKIAKVIPIHKSDPTNEIGNYKPISLLTSLSKLLEKILLKRILSFCNLIKF